MRAYSHAIFHSNETTETSLQNKNKGRELPYNPELIPYAKALRKARNFPEVLLWLQLKKKQINGFDFDRQKMIGNYIVDFYCPACNVVIEIDGASHNQKEEYDEKRDEFLMDLGLVVIHITAGDILSRLNAVLERLRDHSALRER